MTTDERPKPVTTIMYVPVEDDETYEDAWRAVQAYGASAFTDFDNIERGTRAYRFKVDIYYEPESVLSVELSSTIDIIDGKLTGPPDEMLLLARTIHDILEGGS